MQLERRLFSDWLNWLCSDWNHERARAQFEATMDLVAAEMDRAGVSTEHEAAFAHLGCDWLLRRAGNGMQSSEMGRQLTGRKSRSGWLSWLVERMG